MTFGEKIKYLPEYFLGYKMGAPERNGEYRFLEKTIKYGMTIFDVGANIGEYTEKILNISSNTNIFCFEPIKNTFDTLKAKLGNFPNVKLNNFGLGKQNIETEMFVYGDLAGSNSLYYHELHAAVSKNLHTEKIKLYKLDTILAKFELNKIDFMKIDVEGNELYVLEGATTSLNNRLIECIQFEYNSFWQKSHATLEEAFYFLSSKNFRLFRLTPWGKIHISRFDKKLENYNQSNYIALLKSKL